MEPYRERPSKSRRKREVRALQALAARIAACRAEQRATLPISDALDRALQEYDRIPTRDARQRQLRRMARVLDEHEDIAAIEAVLARYDAASAAFARELHVLEAWRDALIADDAALGQLLEQLPKADRQRLRQHIRAARAEAEAQTRGSDDKRAYRALFQLLRDAAQEADALDTLDFPSRP